MKKNIFFIFILLLTLQSKAQYNVLLSIPGRLQWDNANGYCGETSIQMSALYYGAYISEDVCRTVAGGELLVAGNATAALSALSFQYDEWDYSQAVPQYQNYLVWVKQHLNKRQPVIITVYVQGMSDPDYDHIVPAIGFRATSLNTFNGTDQLMFNDCYDSAYYTRSYSSMWDTRSMSGNGADYEYCIPKNIDYGIAVTGIKDDQHVTRPVHLTVDSRDEPNVTLGENPKLLHAVITIDSLIAGHQYALLRYDNYQKVPSSGFSSVNANAVVYFTAGGTTETRYSTFMSNTAVFYRCIPHNTNGIHDTEGLNEIRFVVFPNPAANTIRIDGVNLNQPTDISIINIFGQTLLQKKIEQIPVQLDISCLASGSYVIKISTTDGITCSRFIKR